MKKRLVLALSLLFVLQACTTNFSYTGIGSEEREKIKYVELYHLVEQEEILPMIEHSSVSKILGGGLLAALYTASENEERTRRAHQQLLPIYGELEGFDYRSMAGKIIYSKLKPHFTFFDEKPDVKTAELSIKQLHRKVKTKKSSQSFLYMQTQYHFSNDFRRIISSTKISLFTNSTPNLKYVDPEERYKSVINPNRTVVLNKVKEVEPPVYENYVLYISPEMGDGQQNSLKLWKNNGAELVKVELAKSLKNISSLFINDYFGKRGEECGESVRVKVGTKNDYIEFTGTKLASRGEFYVIRDESGALITMPDKPVFYKYGKVLETCKKYKGKKK